jgi:conjugal transfer pilus assembly protein TraF
MPVPPTRAAWRPITACLGALACLGAHAAAAQAQEQPTSENVEAQDSFYCQERKLGYWFYCAKPKAEKPQKEDLQQPQTATEQLDAITTTLRELKAKAILEPTPANVTAYIRFQREQLDRASLFSDVWQRAIWQDPELDYTLQRPVSTLGKRQWQDSRSAERDAAMTQLSQRYGLFYFFAHSCAACEVMSPIVQGVASRWTITVRAISTDGGPSRHFPGYTVETNQRTRMGLEPKITPAVVLWDALKNQPIPIGYGVMSADELQDRIFLLTSKEAGRDY